MSRNVLTLLSACPAVLRRVRPAFLARIGLAALPLVMLAFGPAPLAFKFDDTHWHFSTASVRFAGKAKGVGSLHHHDVAPGNLSLVAGGSWSLDFIAHEIMAGGWTVESTTDRTIELTLDPTGSDELRTWVAQLLEAVASSKGVSTTIHLTAIKSATMRLSVKTNVKKGTARLKGVTSFKFTGTTDAPGVVNAPTTATYSMKGLSDEVPLSSIMP